MHNDGWQERTRRAWGVAIAALLVVGAITVWLFPRGLRGPESIAREFLELSLQAPDDVARLRAAAHLTDAHDPQALFQGLSTRVTFNFLQAREAQGISQGVSVMDRQQPAPQRYTVTLRISEGGVTGATSPRDFIVQLQQSENGDWRIVSVRVLD